MEDWNTGGRDIIDNAGMDGSPGKRDIICITQNPLDTYVSP